MLANQIITMYMMSLGLIDVGVAHGCTDSCEPVHPCGMLLRLKRPGRRWGRRPERWAWERWGRSERREEQAAEQGPNAALQPDRSDPPGRRVRSVPVFQVPAA